MKAISFPEVVTVLAKDQPEYEPLPVHVLFENRAFPSPTGGAPLVAPVAMEMTACFKLSKEEIEEINRTGVLWYTQCVFGNPFQPVRMSTQNPFSKIIMP